jgi:hypothetical protein
LLDGVRAPVTIAIDTEYFRTHTLTVQAAARVDPGTIAVQLYRSAAIPDLPPGFEPRAYLPDDPGRYNRFYGRMILRPAAPIARCLGWGSSATCLA